MKFLGKKFSNDDFIGLRTLVVPSGIGEFQWVWTKLLNVPGEEFCILGLDGAPRRLHQFCELHPRIRAFGYTEHFDYTRIRMWQDYHKLTTWEAVSSKFGLGQATALACNPHLEAGRPLADWLPDLPTTYSYDLVTSDVQKVTAQKYLQNADHGDVLIGISCASYRGAEAWKTWQRAEWISFLYAIQEEVPNARFVLLGGSWDDLTAAVFDEDTRLRWLVDSRGIPPMGRTDFGTAVEILRGLHGFIGFSSGLGHVALHNCRTPVFMLWPEHEQLLAKSWVDPACLEDGSYVPSRWLPPLEVFQSVTKWLRRIQDGRYQSKQIDPAYSRS